MHKRALMAVTDIIDHAVDIVQGDQEEIPMEEWCAVLALVMEDLGIYASSLIEENPFCLAHTQHGSLEPDFIRGSFTVVGNLVAVAKENDYLEEVQEEKTVIDLMREYIREAAGGDLTVWLNVYRITREYGGPEDGGWWTDLTTLYEATEVKYSDTEKVLEEAQEKYGKGEGDISSVLGGYKVLILVEAERGESEDTETPHYS